MKFVCDSKVLAYAVNKCVSIVQNSRTFPYLSDVKITASIDLLKVSATDNYTFASYYVPVDVVEPGSAIVDARSLAAFLYVKTGELSVHTTDHNFIAKLGGNRVMLKLYKGVYPDFPPIPKTRSVKINGGTMLNLLKVSAMADEDTTISPKFSGTFLMFVDDYVYSMATNKFRLGYSWASVDFTGKTKFLVPQQATNILNRFIDPKEPVKIYHEVEDNKRRLHFVSERFVVSSAELAGEYPYEAIIKMMSATLNHSFSVYTPDLIEALKACKAITGNTKSLGARTITVESYSDTRLAKIKTSEANEIGVMDLQVSISDILGDDILFSINSDFIDRAIGVIEKARKQDEFVEDKIAISLSDETAFIYLSAKGVDSLFTIAPVAQPNAKKEEVSS